MARLGPHSLRARLLLALVALAAIVVLVLDVVTYATLGSYLRNRLDRQVLDTRPAMELALKSQLIVAGPRRPLRLPPGTLGELVNPADGTVLVNFDPTVTLPARVTAGPRDRFVDVVASNRKPYRELIHADHETGALVLVALPRADVIGVLHRLVLTELLLSAGGLVALLGLGGFLVRIGLRPLARIGDTAGAIAAGDLTRRVQPATERTEVGRLGLSLNAMLTQIEGEVARRTASEERMRRFVADASHELRTPLTSIRGYAELFRRGAADRPEDLAVAMRRIESEAGRMGGLVEDLLLLARLDEGRPLERRPVDLAVLAQDAAADARAVAPDRVVTVAVDGSAVVAGDDARLRQVVGNLVRNALNHTPAGSPFSVEVHRADGRVSLAVVDHGPGLGQEQAGHVFDRFWRADPSRHRAGTPGGSGLGLSIVQALAVAHGGEVDLRPTPGGGATFRLLLPALA
jgi:two-component system OmpR family sensor kinase